MNTQKPFNLNSVCKMLNYPGKDRKYAITRLLDHFGSLENVYDFDKGLYYKLEWAMKDGPKPKVNRYLKSWQR
jgi:hypothetical protein